MCEESERSACCAPDAGRELQRASVRSHSEPAVTPIRDDVQVVELSGGEFLMGTDDAIGYLADGEGPVRSVVLSAFRIDATAVSNQRFAAFVRGTGYVTEAERFGASFVFAGLLPDDFPETRGVVAAPWWREVERARWCNPEGLHSDVDARENHPVVHVTHNDALAFCEWAGGRLPTEAEWEYAARGGEVQKRYPWGDELMPGGAHMCNIWQGTFPSQNTTDDGYYGTAPVDAFAPNGYGLYNMCGNAWEWCADWFSQPSRMANALADLRGPESGTHRVIRGGSYLCHESYCFRYRVAARSANTPNSSTGNTGFRCAYDL